MVRNMQATVKVFCAKCREGYVTSRQAPTEVPLRRRWCTYTLVVNGTSFLQNEVSDVSICWFRL